MPRKKIKSMEVMVAEVVRETADTTTLLFFTGNDKLEYKAGHFLTIDPKQFAALARWSQFLEDEKKKKEQPRAYSMASAPHEQYLSITVKEERYISGVTDYPPLLSPVLVRRTPVGTRMQITGFTGPYTLPDDIEDRTDHLVHICAGSGIVPNYSILKHALHHEMKLRHTLIYGNKTWDDVIFRDDLEALAARHPDRLSIFHALSRDPEAARYGENVVAGRVNEAMIREHIPDPAAVEVYTCGPAVTKYEKRKAKEAGTTPSPRFFESTLAALDSIGLTKKQIHKESYG